MAKYTPEQDPSPKEDYAIMNNENELQAVTPPGKKNVQFVVLRKETVNRIYFDTYVL